MTLRLLVVDDNADHRFLAGRALRPLATRIPLAVSFATDGEDALAQLAHEAPPHLILVDIKMPRVSGLELLRMLRAQPATASLPIVVFTSSEADADRERAFALGASEFVTKPLDPERFASALRACILAWRERLVG